MPYGNFYYGKTGFFFKNMGGGGVNGISGLGVNCNQPQKINNRYIPGAGVGATTTSTRRYKMINAYAMPPQKCGPCCTQLGLYPQGSADPANWSLYNGCYTPKKS